MMKKILLFLLPLLLVACSTDEPVVDDNKEEEEQQNAFYSDAIIDGVHVKYAYKNPIQTGNSHIRNSYISLDFKLPYKISTPCFNVVTTDGTIYSKNTITGDYIEVTIAGLEYLKDISFTEVKSVFFSCYLYTNVYDLENKIVRINLYNKGDECDSVLRMFFK